MSTELGGRDIVRYAQILCGTCEHLHNVVHPCPLCGCTHLVLHPTIQRRWGERELMELIDFEGQRPIITIGGSEGILDCLNSYERDVVAPTGWDQPAQIFAVQAEQVQDGDRPMTNYRLNFLRPHALFWSQGQPHGQWPNPMDVIAAMSVQAVQDKKWWMTFRLAAGFSTDMATIGWGAVLEGWGKSPENQGAGASANEREEIRIFESRHVLACDLDSRFYDVTQIRDGERNVSVSPPRAYMRQAEAAAREAGIDPAVILGPSRLPRALQALRRLALISRQEETMAGRTGGHD